MTLTKTRLADGTWEGVLTGADDAPPEIEARHGEQVLGGVEVRALSEGQGHLVRVPVPASLIADGVQTVLLCDKATGARLASFALLAGDSLDDDLRAEIDLLRAELDMLKSAFRRHCQETR
ncbi:hypothetical protein OG2516_12321 [Oceanicola granulosus HTCC2516]|uniref:Uncharacterized protein n=2 Tax=Oceanicola granulosus TaxID=252302 RepID=Q2CD44_OCEGH|nr:hypothetical protein OG2516_12321 [Oceanicola granulosus HTCC2516]